MANSSPPPDQAGEAYAGRILEHLHSLTPLMKEAQKQDGDGYLFLLACLTGWYMAALSNPRSAQDEAAAHETCRVLAQKFVAEYHKDQKESHV